MGTEIPVITNGSVESLASQKSSWETFWSTRKRIHIYENILRLAQERVGDLHDAKVLEVGCGRGATLLHLVKHGALGTGLDYADSAIEFCRELQRNAGVNDRVEFIRGDAFDLPFEPATFDVVYSIGLIEHFVDPALLLAQQFRVLKPGGCLIVQVPQKYSLYTLLKKPLTKLGRWRYGVWETQFSETELRKLAESVGLVPEYSCGYGSFFLAVLRHFFFPNLNFGPSWSFWEWNSVLHFIKSHTALDICLVARKPSASKRDNHS